jgi:RNase adaptor protein for sRNA GlmZ degradation
MNLDSEIIVVSGLPRSGTSLLMQMLHAGGIEVVSDHVRTADVDNPRGYFEVEKAKQIQKDSSWLPEARGKAFKMVSQLLYHLPVTERYRIIFMRRDLDEILVSQEKMLKRRNVPAAPRDQMMRAFTLHLEALFQWLAGQSNMALLAIYYNELVRDPRGHAEKVSQFLYGRPAVEAMIEAVDSDLYRNRSA